MQYAQAFVGGLFIGVSAGLLLVLQGKIFGVSGIISAFVQQRRVLSWQHLILFGMLFASLLLRIFVPSSFDLDRVDPPVLLLTAGVLVGFGTNLANGCTSGHGVCGVARLSIRSLLATSVFLAFGMLSATLSSLW